MRAAILQVSRSGRLRRALAWLALCATLFGALAPAVSKVMAASGTLWVEICSAEGGVRLVALPRPGATPGQAPAQLPAAGDEHCGYCVLQHHTPVLPITGQAFTQPVLAAGRLRIGAPGQTFPSRLIRDAHRARAPPLPA
jgi:hypothetical protein